MNRVVLRVAVEGKDLTDVPRRKPVEVAADAPPTVGSRTFDRSLIVPVVKAVIAKDESTNFVGLPPDQAPIARPLVAELVVMYAIDFPDHFQFISGKHLRENNMTEEQLHELALANLPIRVPPIEVRGASPRYMIIAGGSFEATLLLHDAMWEHLAEHLPGDPMAVVPARDILVVTGSDWSGALEFLTSVANKELPDARYALSKCVLIRREGRWQVYAPAS
jgi:uncharacterized protein YtpQ (UPF0354 family)